MTIGNRSWKQKAVNSVAFPGGPPAQYYPGLASLSYGVRMGSSVFDAVWSTANELLETDSHFEKTQVPDSRSSCRMTIGNCNYREP